MNATQLFKSDGTAVNAWACGECGLIYSEKHPYSSERCCTCQDCGASTHEDKMARKTLCDKCWGPHYAKIDADRMDRAEEIIGYDGPVVYSGDKYFPSVEEMVDYHDDQDLPDFVHTCTIHNYSIDIDEVIQNMIENASVEDFDGSEFTGMAELRAAVDKFNEANKVVVYWEEDSKHKVRIPKARK